MMDNADPKYLFHTKEMSRQKMLLFRNQIAGMEYSSEAYKLYAEVKEYFSYAEFTQRLINFYAIENMGHSRNATAKARMANTDTEESEAFQEEFRKAYAA
jgi:hypothetical protein